MEKNSTLEALRVRWKHTQKRKMLLAVAVTVFFSWLAWVTWDFFMHGFFRNSRGGSLPILFILIAIIGVIAFIISFVKGFQFKKSLLMRNIREEAQREGRTVNDLIEEIEKDVAAYGRTVGTVFIGRKWIIGEQAMRLDRICGIFMDEVTGSKSFLLADEAGAFQLYRAGSRQDLKDAVNYLSYRVPEAIIGDMRTYKRWKESVR